MKKIFGMIPTASIVLAIVTVMFAVWGVYQNHLYQSACGIFDSAAQLEADDLTQAQVNAQNGQLVCLKGKLTLRNAPKDPMTGFSLPDALVLIRRTEMYQYSLSGDSVITDFYDFQQANIRGKNDEYYENPVFPAELGSLTLLADVAVGPVKLADAYVHTFVNGGYTYLEDTEGFVDAKSDQSFENAYRLVLKDGYYANGNPDDPQVGDIRIRYEYIPLSQHDGSLFFFGTLSDGVLGGDGITSYEFMTDGCDTFAQVREKISGSWKQDATELIVLVAFTAATAVFVFVAVTVKDRKRGAGK